LESSHTGKDFASLSRIGKVRRLSQLAAATLSRYDVRVRSMQMHCFATNLLYKVQSDQGERFILRMAFPGWRTLQDLLTEAAWLGALHEDTDIGVPLVIRASNGDLVLPMSGFVVPETWYATLMTWVDERLLAYYLTCANLELMGDLFARLHIHGKSWKPPPDFSTKRFEAFLSRGEPDVVFSDEVIRTFREDDRRAFLLAREWVEREYQSLDRSDLRVIHCDLWHENIKLDHGKLRPFDFEDTIWGYRLHDIAMSMLDLLETVGGERYESLFASFRSGYEKLLDWPEGNLGVLQLGRLLWKANYVARFASESLGSLSQRYGHIFRGFERTGELRLPNEKP
jgi:Ser/Thr protein kinase RdoA (MazF antagonist)